MASPLDIQRLPWSLTGLLGMKSTGDTPHLLAQEVRGIIDLSAMYLVDRTVDAGWVNGIAPAATGFLPVTASATLPQTPAIGTVWLMTYAGLRMSPIAAASSIQIALAVTRVGTGRVHYLTPDLTLPASTAGITHRWFDTPVIIFPGDLIGSFVQNITGAPGVNPSMDTRLAVLTV